MNKSFILERSKDATDTGIIFCSELVYFFQTMPQGLLVGDLFGTTMPVDTGFRTRMSDYHRAIHLLVFSRHDAPPLGNTIIFLFYIINFFTTDDLILKLVHRSIECGSFVDDEEREMIRRITPDLALEFSKSKSFLSTGYSLKFNPYLTIGFLYVVTLNLLSIAHPIEDKIYSKTLCITSQHVIW